MHTPKAAMLMTTARFSGDVTASNVERTLLLGSIAEALWT